MAEFTARKTDTGAKWTLIDGTRRGRFQLRHGVGVSAAVVLLTAAGCIRIGPSVPSTLYTPDLVRPINDIREVPESDFAHDVVLGDQTIRITPDEPPRPLGGGGLAEDWLFLYGGEGDESWWWVITRATTGELAATR